MRHRVSLALFVTLGVIACGGASNRPTGPRQRADMIEADEIRRGQYSSAYDLIRNARPRWMQPRGRDTIVGQPGEVQVVVDDIRLGGVATLREVPVIGIAYIQFIDPNTAAGRWGLGFGHGAIYISTRR